MPSSLALLAVFSFVIFLLWLDKKEAPTVSWKIWIPTVWYLYASSKPIGIWLGSGATDIESGSPYDRAFIIALLIFGIIVLSRKIESWSSALKTNGLVFILIGYMLVSIFWSDIPFISFKRWTRELVPVIMAFIIMSENDPKQALHCIIRRFVFILIPISILLIKYFPYYGIEFGRWSGWRMWIGVAMQKNGLARLCIMSTLFLIWTLIRRLGKKQPAIFWYQTPLEAFLLLLSLYMLGGPNHSLSYSATSTVSLFAGLFMLFLLYWMNKRGAFLNKRLIVLFIMLVVAYGLITPFMGRLSILNVHSIFNRDETLKGRTEMWTLFSAYAMQRPILGHGVGGFWTTATRGLASSHAHSGYLEVILHFGITGFVLVFMITLSWGRSAFALSKTDLDWGILFLSFLLMTLIYNIAETGLDSLTSPMIALLLFFSFVSHKLQETMVQE